MKTGFVIVNYNDFETTKKLIDNIKNYKIIEEIVVVDNNSKDKSLLNLNNLKIKNLTVLLNSENKGYSNALNLGTKYLINKYHKLNIFVSNSDIEISNEKDLSKMVDLIKKDIVIVGPNINTHGNISKGWKIPTINQEIIFNLPILQNIMQNRLFYNDSEYQNNSTNVDTVSGCFFLINSKHLEDINYFDDNVFLYYEENILGVKTKKANKKIVVANKVIINHNHSVTIDKCLKKINKVKMQKKSQFYFEKNYNKANKLQLFLLKITAFITIILLKVKYVIEDRI